MDFIKNRKINKWIVIAALYVSMCFAYFVPTRANLALLAINYSFPSWVNNDIVAFLLAGLAPTALYEVITLFALRFMSSRTGIDGESLRYALRFFYIPAAIVTGGIKLIFLFFPLGGIWAGTLADLLVPLPFFVLFMAYCFKTYPDKTRYANLVYVLGGTFLVIYAALALAELLMGVMS